MGATDPGTARQEAERLVATVLATVRLAAANPSAASWGPLGGIVTSVLGHTEAAQSATGPPGAGFATGAAECCVCPVCRGIATLRDPSPEFAERLATGAGDLAAGLASFLRAFAPADPSADASTDRSADPSAAPSADRSADPSAGPSADSSGPAAAGPDSDHVWREATRTGHDSQPVPERDIWSAATRAEDVVPTARAEDAAVPTAAQGAPGDGA